MAGNTEKIGYVRVADDVVPIIAAITATEVDGVVSVADNLKGELINKMGIHKAPKGVKVVIKDRKVALDMAIGIKYGSNVPETCRNVQDKVKTAIETMLGLEVSDVNIRIAFVDLPKDK